MTEQKENLTATPKAEKEQASPAKTAANEDLLIPVKFNKETKNISLTKAAELIQKGMKYDIIKNDYEALKALAKGENKSVSDFLILLKTEKAEERKKQLTEKCGGDAELAEHFLALEQGNSSETDNGFAEIKKYFPEINSPEQLPDTVLECCEEKGTKLLDEYLRFLLIENREKQKAEAENRKADKRSLGSLKNKGGAIDPEAAEFLKGLWK